MRRCLQCGHSEPEATVNTLSGDILSPQLATISISTPSPTTKILLEKL